MKKFNVTHCVKCHRIKHFGTWYQLTLEDMQAIKENTQYVSIVEETCENCLNGEEPCYDHTVERHKACFNRR